MTLIGKIKAGLHCAVKSWQCASFQKCFFVLNIDLDYSESGHYLLPQEFPNSSTRRAGAGVQFLMADGKAATGRSKRIKTQHL
jgi:hypothetical protein